MTSAKVTAEYSEYLDTEELEANSFHTRNLPLLIRYILKHPGPLGLGVMTILVGTVAALLEPRLFGYAIDEAILPKRWEFLRLLGECFFLLICIRVASTIAQTYLFEKLGQRVTQDLRCALFSHIQRLPLSTFDRNPAGRLLTRVTNDVASLGEMFSAGFVSMIGNALMVLGILTCLLTLDFKLGLIALSVFPVLVIASIHFSGRLRVSYRVARSKLSALNSFLAENFLGVRVVHLFNRQKLHLNRFDRINQDYAEAQISGVRIFAYFQPTITWCSGLTMALVIGFGGGEAVHGTIKIGVLVAYFSYIVSIFQPMREIADKWNIFLSGMASAERIFSILDWPTEMSIEAGEGHPRKLENIRGQIVFENLWFAYGGENWVIRNFSLTVPSGSKCGIVGHTGAGKTTLIGLLLRFYEPQRGRILLDGIDIRSYDKRSLRSCFGIVQQDVFLFSGSIHDNTTFWGSLSGPAMHDLASFPVVSTFEPDRLLERGSNLSGGERQKLAFMRAQASHPKVWILDEATSNMDSESEILLQQSLERSLDQKQTLIIIAHRLATVRKADQIIVLNKGALVEQGNHAELVSRNGLYARLHRYQAVKESHFG